MTEANPTEDQLPAVRKSQPKAARTVSPTDKNEQASVVTVADWPFPVWNGLMCLLIWLTPRWPWLRRVLGSKRTSQRPTSRSTEAEGR